MSDPQQQLDDLLDLAIEHSAVQPAAGDEWPSLSSATAEWAWLRYQVLRADQARERTREMDARNARRIEAMFLVDTVWKNMTRSERAYIGEHDSVLANTLDALRQACEPEGKP